MKLLFDTHAFIWWDSEPQKLTPQIEALCRDRSNTLIFSVASAWEMQIKSELGKMRFEMPLASIVENQTQTNGVQVLPILLPHVLALENLPPHHKDPFDRLLIAQAIAENAVLLSADPVFAQYPVQVLW
jgi:PIN domain nuclease of toxin-antitoxin system